MTINKTFKSWEELNEHLQNADNPPCTIYYLPRTEDYQILIGNELYLLQIPKIN